MNVFTAIVMTFCLFLIVGNVAPMVGDYQRGEAAKVQASEYKAKSEALSVKLCAEGKGNAYIYNGVKCYK